MNTLDLQALGLEEMNEMQMYDVDGGISWTNLGWLLVGCGGIAAITYYSMA